MRMCARARARVCVARAHLVGVCVVLHQLARVGILLPVGALEDDVAHAPVELAAQHARPLDEDLPAERSHGRDYAALVRCGLADLDPMRCGFAVQICMHLCRFGANLGAIGARFAGMAQRVSQRVAGLVCLEGGARGAA